MTALRYIADWLADKLAAWLAPRMAEKLAAQAKPGRGGGPGEEGKP